MASDRYTKAVLTVIAAALVGLVAQNATREATAQAPAQTQTQCTVMTPCYVVNVAGMPLYVTDVSPRGASERFRNLPPASGQPK